MTTLSGRPQSALLVVDTQVGVLADAHGRDAVVGRVAELVDRARGEQVPVVWVQHHDDDLPRGSDAWQLVDELRRRDDEPLVDKQHGDAFEGTDLEEVLARLQVGRLVLAGAQTDQCVRSTLHGGFARGYDVTLISDAHATEDFTSFGAPPPEQVVAHTNLYWRYQTAPGRTAAVETAAEVRLAAADVPAQAP